MPANSNSGSGLLVSLFKQKNKYENSSLAEPPFFFPAAFLKPSVSHILKSSLLHQLPNIFRPHSQNKCHQNLIFKHILPKYLYSWFLPFPPYLHWPGFCSSLLTSPPLLSSLLPYVRSFTVLCVHIMITSRVNTCRYSSCVHSSFPTYADLPWTQLPHSQHLGTEDTSLELSLMALHSHKSTPD